MKKLKIIAYNLLLYGYILFSVPPMALIIILCALIDKKGLLPHRLSTLWLKGVIRCSGVQIEVRGLELLKPERSYVFAANHQSQFDIPVLGVVLPFQVRWLAKESLFRIPFFGWALKATGYIPIDRQNPRRGLRSLEAAAQKVKKGFSVIIFPEGTRSPDGRLLSFKSGGFVLAIKSGQPVVPIAICGTRKVMPRGRLWVTPGLVRVKIYKPIETKGLTLRDKAELSQLVYLTIKKGVASGCR